MPRDDGKRTLTLQLFPEDREMIKADAHAMGMVPSRYVAMVCRMVNETAREDGLKEFTQEATRLITKSVLAQLEKK